MLQMFWLWLAGKPGKALFGKTLFMVFCRWYGGVQLGPDRFKHINNVARQLLEDHGFITQGSNSSTKTKGRRHKC
jgi:hypothetical protein